MPDVTADPPPRAQPPSGGPPLEVPSAAFLLMSLGRLVREDVERGLRAHGLSLRHLSALGHLSHEPGLSYSELGRRAGVTAQSMQATLAQLEAMSAVERRTPPGRGRTAQLHVTEHGHDLLHHGRGAVDDAGQRVLAAVPPDQHDHLTDLLLRAFTAAVRRPTGSG